MKRLEFVISFLAVISIILNLIHIVGGNIFLVASIGLLSMFYFHFGFAIFNNIKFKGLFKKESYKGIRGLRIFGGIVAGITISVTLIGILYKIQNYPGANLILIEGLTFLIAVIIVSSIRFSLSKNENKYIFYKGVLIRVGILFIIALTALIIPKMTFYEIKFRNNPEYLKALKKAYDDPKNDTLWENVEKEREKL